MPTVTPRMAGSGRPAGRGFGGAAPNIHFPARRPLAVTLRVPRTANPKIYYKAAAIAVSNGASPRGSEGGVCGHTATGSCGREREPPAHGHCRRRETERELQTRHEETAGLPAKPRLSRLAVRPAIISAKDKAVRHPVRDAHVGGRGGKILRIRFSASALMHLERQPCIYLSSWVIFVKENCMRRTRGTRRGQPRRKGRSVRNRRPKRGPPAPRLEKTLTKLDG